MATYGAIEIAKAAFTLMGNRYEKIFESGFYPARKSTGFTEQNLVHSYVNALVHELGDDAIEWLEFPWEDNKQHIDAIVFSKRNQIIYYIEAKRLSVERENFKKLNDDIERVSNNYYNEVIIKDLHTHHKIDTKKYNHCIVALADIWTEHDWKKNIFYSWKGDETLSDRFEQYKNLSNLLQDKNRQYTSTKEFATPQNYKLLLAIQPLLD